MKRRLWTRRNKWLNEHSRREIKCADLLTIDYVHDESVNVWLFSDSHTTVSIDIQGNIKVVVGKQVAVTKVFREW